MDKNEKEELINLLNLAKIDLDKASALISRLKPTYDQESVRVAIEAINEYLKKAKVNIDWIDNATKNIE